MKAALRSRALEARGRHPHLLAVKVSFEVAEKAYQEAVANLRLGESRPGAGCRRYNAVAFYRRE
jgi:hypothetical protein